MICIQLLQKIDEPVVIAKVSHPIPFRTRPLNPFAPMILCLKTRESRSPPVLLSSASHSSFHFLLLPLLSRGLSFFKQSKQRSLPPIPLKTRPLNLTPPMILCLSRRESLLAAGSSIFCFPFLLSFFIVASPFERPFFF